jgi:hypothetical protein
MPGRPIRFRKGCCREEPNQTIRVSDSQCERVYISFDIVIVRIQNLPRHALGRGKFSITYTQIRAIGEAVPPSVRLHLWQQASS